MKNKEKLQMAIGALEGIYCNKTSHGDEKFYKWLKEIIEELNK